ncbi:MAG TPA: ABC transporter permease [Jiangellaceae bacterium]
MFSFAARNLGKERVRLAISVGGVAFAVMLIVLLRGLYVAYETKVSDVVERVPAELWVVQRGTADFFHSYSLVPESTGDQVAALPGVAAVHPYLARQVGFSLRDEQTLLYLVGFDPADPVSGPPEVVSGTDRVAPDGIVVDEVFAANHDVGLGDTLTLNGFDLEVAGVSRGGDMVMYQYAYVTTPTARNVLSMPDQNNALLVQLAPGTDPESVAERISSLSSQLRVRDTDAMVAVNQRVITDSFLPVISVLLVIGFVVGVAVIGLTIYSAVLEKRREYGVVKALGARSWQLTAVVAIQALLAAAGGYLVGVGLAVAGRQAAERWVPAFVADIVPGDLVRVAAATVAMAVIAAVIPLARIARIDSAEVFRA